MISWYTSWPPALVIFTGLLVLRCIKRPMLEEWRLVTSDHSPQWPGTVSSTAAPGRHARTFVPSSGEFWATGHQSNIWLWILSSQFNHNTSQGRRISDYWYFTLLICHPNHKQIMIICRNYSSTQEKNIYYKAQSVLCMIVYYVSYENVEESMRYVV